MATTKKPGLNIGALKKAAAAPKTAEQKEDRPVMTLTPADEAQFVSLVEMSAVNAVVSAQFENQKGVVTRLCYDEFINYVWKYRKVPANPAIQTKRADGKVDLKAIYQFHAAFSIDIPKPTDDQSGEDLLLEALTGGDGDDRLEEAEALRLIKDEVDLTPIFQARSLNELLVGHYKESEFIPANDVEQSAGAKLQEFYTARAQGEDVELDLLTDEEGEVAIETVVVKRMRDPKGFLARVCGYCKTKDQLRRVLSIIKPRSFPSHMKFAVSDTPDVRNERLQTIARSLIGIPSNSDD